MADSKVFNAEKYYEKLITTSSLAQLMATANTLSAGQPNQSIRGTTADVRQTWGIYMDQGML